MFLQMLRKTNKQQQKKVLLYAVSDWDHSHFDTHFSSLSFEGKVQEIHSTDKQQFLLNHTLLETSALLGLRESVLLGNLFHAKLSNELMFLSTG